MPKYAAFLRGVSPMNAKMPDLKRAFEAASFDEVKTLLSSGNLVFAARAASPAALQRKAEAAMEKTLGRAFLTIVRPIDELQELLESDPYRGEKLRPASKRVITFLREPSEATLRLPVALGGARIVRRDGLHVFSWYLPSPRAPVFMTLIEKTFGKEVTTRTWETVTKVSHAG